MEDKDIMIQKIKPEITECRILQIEQSKEEIDRRKENVVQTYNRKSSKD